jgi:outer membrane protein assembly factor BamB
MRSIFVAFALTACTASEPEPTTDVSLVKVHAFAGEHHVVGLDVDHEGGVWLAYQLQSGVYTFDDLRLVHLDHAGTKLHELRYTQPDQPVSGLAVAGGALWVNYGGAYLDLRNHVRKLDPDTGAELARLEVEDGIVDLAARDGLLLLSSCWRELLAIDATTGEQQWRAPLPALANSESRGIASDGASTWVVALDEARAVRVDDTGATLETASFPFPADDWMADDGLHLAVDGTKLVLHRRNQITYYERQRN